MRRRSIGLGACTADSGRFTCGVLLCVLAGLSACVGGSAWGSGGQKTGVSLIIGSARGEPGTTVYVPVTLVTGGNPVAAITLSLAFDASKMAFGEVIPGEIVAAAGKEVEALSPGPGLVNVVVYGLSEGTLADGALFALAFDLLPDANDSVVLIQVRDAAAADPEGSGLEVEVVEGYVALGDADVVAVGPNPGAVLVGQTLQLQAQSSVPQDTSYTWGSDNPDVAAVSQSGLVTGVSIGSATITATGNSGTEGRTTVTVSCYPVGVPGNVRISAGVTAGTLLLQWSPVPGPNIEYQVYRSPTDDLEHAELIGGWQTETEFLDDAGRAPGRLAFGCVGPSPMAASDYYYWVRARSGVGCEGDLSRAVNGRFYKKVLPAAAAGGGRYTAQPDSDLAIRLRSTDVIDPMSVWGLIAWDGFETDAVEWLPVMPGTLDDGWVVYRPVEPWAVGDTVTMTVGALTELGEPVGPVSYEFVVCAGKSSPGELGSIQQPGYAEFDASGLDLTQEGIAVVRVSGHPVAGLPPLPGGMGRAYGVGPETAFDVPQRVWLPVPAGTAVEGLGLYYCHRSGERGAWFAAADVDGWVVPDSYLELELNGTTWLGFVVTHGGVVRLAYPGQGELTSLAAAEAQHSGTFGGRQTSDLLLVASVALLLSVVGRRPDSPLVQ